MQSKNIHTQVRLSGVTAKNTPSFLLTHTPLFSVTGLTYVPSLNFQRLFMCELLKDIRMRVLVENEVCVKYEVCVSVC